jgi:predicted metal-dependent hydrolase
MVTKISLGEIEAEVTFKAIKNVHLSVHPPLGRVRIAAPANMKLDTVRVFAIAKLGWIKQQQCHLLAQKRETLREYVDRESHQVWGRRVLLTVLEQQAAPQVTVNHRRMILRVRPGSDRQQRQEILERWYRDEVRDVAETLIPKWEKRLKVKIGLLFVQRMKTKWGSCNPVTRNIRLNTDLAKKPPECLEYILVHELVHLLEPTHNARFVAWMDRVLPQWQLLRQQLNQLPLRHQDWDD